MKKHIYLIFSLLLILSTSLFSQIPNSGFETWSGNDPANWDNLNSLTSALGTYTCTKGTPGNPGASYINLTTKSVIIVGVVPAVALCGTIDKVNFVPKSGFPYTQRPLALTGSWQYQASGADQGFVGVAFTKWNTISNKRDTLSATMFQLPGSVISWTNFSIPITFNSSANPDTCLIVLSASGSTPVANSYLYVDNLNFIFTIGVNEIKACNKIKLYPNPTKENLHIEIPDVKENTKFQYQIINYLGEVIMSSVTSYENEIETSVLPAGFYQLVIKTDKNQYNTKFIKE
ncbi:MAG: T9SS type A sorting domain-containing protein [Bacteroidetes bacterium]|nr:T9SS type A sorting domain-containing protein [Bacteroidota bacterium]